MDARGFETVSAGGSPCHIRPASSGVRAGRPFRVSQPLSSRNGARRQDPRGPGRGRTVTPVFKSPSESRRELGNGPMIAFDHPGEAVETPAPRPSIRRRPCLYEPAAPFDGVRRSGFRDFKITRSRIVCTAKVTGIDPSAFAGHAEAARADCPVPQALAGTEITLEARLAAD